MCHVEDLPKNGTAAAAEAPEAKSQSEDLTMDITWACTVTWSHGHTWAHMGTHGLSNVLKH